MHKVSVVVTILNESKTIEQLLTALLNQTVLPNEVVIVDGGSSDDSLEKVTLFLKKYPASKITWTILSKSGNRSVGRNLGIEKAQNNLIAITDAGCIPFENWLEELEKATQSHLQEKQGQLLPFVLAGYYSSTAQTAFEQAVIPYVLVMPDQIHPDDFLPATRSMMLTKSAWEKGGKFNENLKDNEDFAFAQALQRAQVPMFFTAEAKVEWIPRSTLSSFGWMIFRFARGDVYSGIIRKKVLFLFFRYFLVLILTVMSAFLGVLKFAVLFDLIGLVMYLGWSIAKNLRYAPTGWYWLPVLQLTADLAVLTGSLAGWWQKRV